MLDTIRTPGDIKNLSLKEKKQLAEEIRERLVNVVMRNGGHLASNLGVVELTIALYSIVDPFSDKIVWDVGHQSYVHKILTGRNDDFDTLRTFGGISGFPKRSESDADCFETGHSSTSVSAAIGMARARDIQGEKYRVAAVIGDGSFTNGMVYEALNDAGRMFGSVVFILNDNGMSISRNVGGMSRYLGKIRTGKSYIKIKKTVKQGLGRIPRIGNFVIRKIKRMKTAFRVLTIPGEWFEEIGLKYIGPVDGHNIEETQKAIEKAFYMDRPVIVHVITKKGYGYPEAEENPSAYHGVSPSKPKMVKYSGIMAEKLCDMAQMDPAIAAITAAMPTGTGLAYFADRFPERFFDVGIAEEHAVTMAAGMAASGLKPYVALYSTFMQRAYDQLLHDCALQKLHVVITLDRAGISGRDGRTHHGIYDIAFLNSIPGISVCAPCCKEELVQMLDISSDCSIDGPFVIRYPAEDNYSGDRSIIGNSPVLYGRGAVIHKTNLQSAAKIRVLILTIGQIAENCIQASRILEEQNAGIDITVFNARFLKPLDEKGILDQIKAISPDIIFTAEDGVINGGFAYSIAMLLKSNGDNTPLEAIGIPEEPIEHGSIDELYKKLEIDGTGIADRIIRAAAKTTGEICNEA